MLAIDEGSENHKGTMWQIHISREKSKWFTMVLPLLVMKDEGLAHQPRPSLQRRSDLELNMLSLHFLRAPSVMFFPYTTYEISAIFSPNPLTLTIPREPLNRINGKNWLLARSGVSPCSLVNDQHAGHTWTWANKDHSETREFDFEEETRLAAAARAYLFEEIRYVYDEKASIKDGMKSSRPSRYEFALKNIDYSSTKYYIRWYVSRYNELIERLIAIGKPNASDRQKALVTGWTLNRLAVDAYTILVTDAPYLRKWQFFGFLDALAALRNELDKTGHDKDSDRRTATSMLSREFYSATLLPVLRQIPQASLQAEIEKHTGTIYSAIENLDTGDAAGADLLWDYRNTRHGYTLRNTESRRRLLLHDGAIPNDLPDLAIALWHYLLLSFPFL